MLSELADILAVEEAERVDTPAAADSREGAGPEVAMAALTAAVHLLQWDQHVVSAVSGRMDSDAPGPSVAGSSPDRFCGRRRLDDCYIQRG